MLVFRPHDDAPVALTGGWARHGRCRPSAGRGRADRPGRSGGALDAHRLCVWGCGGPNYFWGGDRRASTMFQKPPKRVCDPRMRDQSAVVARGGAAPTGAAPAGTFSTPVSGEPWRTRPQFPVHGGLPSPAPGGAECGFAAALCSPHAFAWSWPSNMVAAPTACDLGTPGSHCSNRAPLGVLNRYVHARNACLS